MEQDRVAGVLHSQRGLAVTEMIKTIIVIWLTRDWDIYLLPTMLMPVVIWMLENKIALLSGDYLLSKSCIELANLRNKDLVGLMSSAVRNLAEAKAVGRNNPFPARPKFNQVEYTQFTENNLKPLVVSEALGNARAEWSLRHVLNAVRAISKPILPSVALSLGRTQEVRHLSSSGSQFAKLAQEKKPDWNRAVSEAEKIVGYPTSFLNLRWLLSDEIANIALHLRKLVGSNHPLLKTTKGLLYNGKNNMQAWGLIVLLVSKAAGHSPDIPDIEQDKAAGILHSQRDLAEITEMIRTSHLVHKGLVNLQPPNNVDDGSGDMMFGNKIALLSGDYLLSKSSVMLANLRNQDLIELMSSAGRDLAEAEFVGPRDKQNNPLPARPNLNQVEYTQFTGNNLEPLVVSEALGNAQAEWTLRHVLNTGSLLGKSCQGTLKLAGHSEGLQEKGYLFGKHLALAWQACLDSEPFQPGSSGSFSLVCAPLLFTLQNKPELYKEIEKGQENVDDVDYELLREEVMEGPGLDLTKKLQKEHSQAALTVLNELPASEARTALANIIAAVQKS